MQSLPHRYVVTANAAERGDVELTAAALPRLMSASPAEFGGPGTLWSPETLLVAAIGDCLILTFRAVARASRVEWVALRCEVAGTLARQGSVTQFTAFDVHATLSIPTGGDAAAARQALQRAERQCLIANSLKAPIALTIDIAAHAPALTSVGA